MPLSQLTMNSQPTMNSQLNLSMLNLIINGQTYAVTPGISVAAALAQCGILATRSSVTGQARGPVCGMGVCQECRVTINGRPHQLACQTMCNEGFVIETGSAS